MTLYHIFFVSAKFREVLLSRDFLYNSPVFYLPTMARGDVILRFDEVTFGYTLNRELLDEASFSVRDGMKVTIV